ncbi:MAG: hypothetical protein JNK86_07470 [Alphaproteobacteria bacterium]|nr:hypothetical protein [Alphaproteobacteria bacterium]
MSKKTGLSKDWAYGFVRGYKAGFNPRQMHIRKTLSDGLDVRMPIKDGYQLFTSDDFTGTKEIVTLCQQIAAEKINNPSKYYEFNKKKKGFLLALLNGDEILAIPEIINFAVSKQIIDRVTQYFSSIPLLAGVRLWWSPPNNSLHESQLFHLDTEDQTQLKMFININNVTEQHGPLAFLPATHSTERLHFLSTRALYQKKYFNYRWQDDEILSPENKQHLIKLVGTAGSGAFVDTSRCLHYGSRENSYDRVVLMIHFQRIDAPRLSNAFFRIPSNYPLLSSLTKTQRLVLGFTK